MKKNIFLILLIFGSSVQAAKVRSFKKYATYLGLTALGGIATLLATQHKKTRPYFRKLLFPNYLQAHQNLNNEITTLNQRLQNTTIRMQNINGLLEGVNEAATNEQARTALQNEVNRLNLSYDQLQNRFTLCRMDQTSKDVQLNMLKAKVSDEYLPLINSLAGQLQSTQQLCQSQKDTHDCATKLQQTDFKLLSNYIKPLIAKTQEQELKIQTLLDKFAEL